MPKYRFVVQSPSGKVRRGSITEKDESSAQASLEKAGFKVMTLSEEPDLVIHTPSSTAASARPRSKPQRVALIEFEETLGEKFKSFLHTYVLRREVTILLSVAGLVWIVFAWTTREEPAPPPELEYTPYTLTVTIDNSGFPDSGRAKVRIPEIPFMVTQDLDSDSSPQDVKIEIESAKEPKTVEVTLLEGTATPVAKGQGTLERGATDGTFKVQVSEFTAIEEES